MKPFLRAWLRPAYYPAFAVFLHASLSVASAQNKDAGSEEAIELSPFTVAAKEGDRYRAADSISAVRIRAPLIDTGSSISVLTREFMDDVAPTRLFDATRYIAGVQEGRIFNFQDRMIFRGFENNVGRTVDNFQSDSGQNYDESLVERIEVSKGPNAILSPAGTPGGTVNVVTKSPLFTRHNVLTASVGSYEANRVSLDLTGPLPNMPTVAYRLIGTLQDTRREWESDARLRRKILAPETTIKLGATTQISIKAMFADSWAANPPLYVVDSTVSLPNQEARLDPVLQKESMNGLPPWSGVHYVDLGTTVQITSAISENINLRIAGNARREREDSIQASPVLPGISNRYEPTTGLFTPSTIWTVNSATGASSSVFSPLFDFTAVSLDRNRADTNNTYAAGQIDLAATYKLGPITSQTVAGGGMANQHTYDRRFRSPIVPFNLAAKQFVQIPDFPTWYQDNRTSNRNNQIYVNERLGFFDDRLYLNGGFLRYSVYSTARDAFSNTPATVLDSGKNMGMGSIVIKPFKNISVYSSYSTNSVPSVANNLPLWADGKQIEYGVKSEFFNQQLSFTAAHFQITQTNVSTPNPNRLFDPSLPATILNDYKDHGYEFEAMGAITKNISVIAAYTHLRLRDSLGRTVRAIADDTGSFLVKYRQTSGVMKGFSTALGATYSGKKAGDVPATNFTPAPYNVITKHSFLVKAYTLFNANVSYRWKNMTYTVLVDNLFDEDGITQGGGRAALGLAPAFRRNIRLNISYEL